MTRPLTQSDLIFPAQSLSFSSTLSSLKRSALSTHNRLKSIELDANFVASVSEAYDLPLVANERCGSWYIPPESKAGSAYFKSTDGHDNEWKFSVRRLNLHVLDLIGLHGGCVIVDSTRRGKSMPDALSKTIPIWCCVMNRALFPDCHHELHTPPHVVSESEHAHIRRRMEGFLHDFLDICKPQIELLRARVQKPLRPIWVTQKSSLPQTPPAYADFQPVVLCTASRRVNGAEGSEGGYIQGAADDHEAWSYGLTPVLFWSHREHLLDTNEEDIPELIAKLVKEEEKSDAVPILIKPTSILYIASSQNLDTSRFDIIINCGPERLPEHIQSLARSPEEKRHIWLECQAGKMGSRNLRDQLSRLRILEDWLGSTPATVKIIVCDLEGRDFAVGVALAILCKYANNDGVIAFVAQPDSRNIDKRLVKERLSWITTTHPTLNPPRETLKSVNTYLMPNISSKTIDLSPTGTPAPASRDTQALQEVTSGAVPRALVVPQVSATEIKSSVASSRIFTALYNNGTPWTLSRTLSSTLPTHPSGTVHGTANFTVHPSSPNTLLYTEEGEFTTTTGLRMTVRRQYIYRLQEDQDNEYIAVNFYEEGKEIGGLFVEMGELEPTAEGGLEAKSRERHLCGQDVYTAHWKFSSDMWSEGGERREDCAVAWAVTYEAKGPKKDYVSETRYA